MKKTLVFAFTAMVAFCISCNSGTTAAENSGHEAEQKNIAAFETVSKAFDTGETSPIDSVVADNFVDHSDHGDVVGKDSLKAMITMMHEKFKDMKTERINTAASGDYVYAWMRYTGTSDGTMGMPSGPYDMKGIELVKFNDGKAVEHWAFMEMQEMMKMMGSQPAMGAMDSTKMK
ncbi:MAG: ester cyclase [Ferruginibacter sp.]